MCIYINSLTLTMGLNIVMLCHILCICVTPLYADVHEYKTEETLLTYTQDIQHVPAPSQLTPPTPHNTAGNILGFL